MKTNEKEQDFLGKNTRQDRKIFSAVQGIDQSLASIKSNGKQTKTKHKMANASLLFWMHFKSKCRIELNQLSGAELEYTSKCAF